LSNFVALKLHESPVRHCLLAGEGTVPKEVQPCVWVIGKEELQRPSSQSASHPDDAVHAWQTGKFEGEGVFQAQDLSSRSLLQVPGKGPIVSRTPVRICVAKRQSQTMLESISTSPASEVQGNGCLTSLVRQSDVAQF
jgi:hypothetical protein